MAFYVLPVNASLEKDIAAIKAPTQEIKVEFGENNMVNRKPNILVIMGDDISYWNISAYNRGMMGYRMPNIDRIGKEGTICTDAYGQQSCTAGRAAFILGQTPARTGLTKIGMPGGKESIQPEDPTIAELLKPLGYATGQTSSMRHKPRYPIGKNSWK